MIERFKDVIAFALAMLGLIGLAACGGTGSGGNTTGVIQANILFADDFKGVCSGAPLSVASAYVPDARAHRAVFFASDGDDLSDHSYSLPRDWTAQFAEGQNTYKAIDLVVCARRTTTRQVKVCGGYKNDDRPTRNQVRWHTATYELSVREARTGKQLATRTIEASAAECPMFQSFGSDTEVVDGYASLSDTIVADFLRPYISH